jgi:hypothetical protein
MTSVDFSSLADNKRDIPYSGGDVAQNALNLTNPDSVLSGTMRGTQGVGSGGAKIDSANNRITLTKSDGSSVGIGSVPNSTTGEYGFFGTDTAGNVVFKIVGSTFYVYDITNGTNVMQMGKLPNNTYNVAIAQTGQNVADGL